MSSLPYTLVKLRILHYNKDIKYKDEAMKRQNPMTTNEFSEGGLQ